MLGAALILARPRAGPIRRQHSHTYPGDTGPGAGIGPRVRDGAFHPRRSDTAGPIKEHPFAGVAKSPRTPLLSAFYLAFTEYNRFKAFLPGSSHYKDG